MAFDWASDTYEVTVRLGGVNPEQGDLIRENMDYVDAIMTSNGASWLKRVSYAGQCSFRGRQQGSWRNHAAKNNRRSAGSTCPSDFLQIYVLLRTNVNRRRLAGFSGESYFISLYVCWRWRRVKICYQIKFQKVEMKWWFCMAVKMKWKENYMSNVFPIYRAFIVILAIV